MPPLIEAHRAQVQELCRRHGVQRLEVFGSAAKGTFAAATSDLDFLVEFQPAPPVTYSRNYFALWRDLEALFGRSVALVESLALRNPYFLRAIAPSRTVLYAA